MGDSPSKKLLVQLLMAVRVVILVPILINVTLLALAVYVAIAALHSKCPQAVVASVISIAFVTSIRLIWLIINGFIQAVTASVMNAVKPIAVSSGSKSSETDRRVSMLNNILFCKPYCYESLAYCNSTVA